jgi:DNA replication protein DnaC
MAQNTLDLVKSYLQQQEIEEAIVNAKKLVNYWKYNKKWAIDVENLFKKYNVNGFTCKQCKSYVENHTFDFLRGNATLLCDTCRNTLIQKESERRIISSLKESGVPNRYLDTKIQDFPEEYRKLTEISTGIYLNGDCGVGKTHLMIALLRNDIFKRENLDSEPFNIYEPYPLKPDYKKPLFITAPELLLELRSTYNE